MDDVTLANRSLLLAGCNRITTLNDDSDEAEAARELLPAVKDEVMGLHPWRFGVEERELARQPFETPMDSQHFEAVYLLPVCERVISVRVNGQPITFDRYGDRLQCDAQATDLVVAELVIMQALQDCPAYFISIVQNKLAAAFAIALAEDTDKAMLYERKASMALTGAKTADSQGRTAGRIGLGGFRSFVGGGPR